MKKPYIKKLITFDGFTFWYVDGFWIRKNIEEEFTNYGDFLSFKFIPKNEIWIDKEYSKEEWRYFVKFFLAKNKYLSKGKSYKEVIRLANDVEQNERNKNQAVKSLKKFTKDEIIKKIHEKLLKKYSNEKVKVWIVNGFLVRSLFFLDFTEGGHDLVYKFVPKGEIWIDDALNPKEIEYTLIHELNERHHMAIRKEYNDAHYNYASKLELFARKNPKKINKILKKELKKQY